MTTVSAERARQVANCRVDSWIRLYPVLAALHVSLDDGPGALIDVLTDAPLQHQAEAQRVLRMMNQINWQVEPLSGPYAKNPWLGFRLSVGPQVWWLRFEPNPRMRIRQIERVAPPQA
jgi:hypothetical protein